MCMYVMYCNMMRQVPRKRTEKDGTAYGVCYLMNLIIEKEPSLLCRHSSWTIRFSPLMCWMLPHFSQTESPQTSQGPRRTESTAPQ